MHKIVLIALLEYIQMNILLEYLDLVSVLLEYLNLVTVLLEYIDCSFMKSLIILSRY